MLFRSPKIEYRERRLVINVLQQRRDVLADVVIVRAFPEVFGTLVVIFQGDVDEFFQVLWIQFHFGVGHAGVRPSSVR